MSLFSAFRKPAWQSSNVSKRLAAVASSDDAQLRAVLPTLAVDDPDPDVRREALRRCDDPALYARAMDRDAATAIRSWARERWLAALTEGRVQADETALTKLSGDELEALATRQTAADVRQRLLLRINRPGFLAERALADPDANVRLALLERIDTVATLERIADKARRFDKRLARAARERVDALRLAAGDSDIQSRRAEALCLSLERVMREPLALDERRARLTAHETDWRALDAEALSAELHARFAGAREVILAQLEPPAPPPPIEPEPEAIEPETEAPPSLEEIAAQARLQAELATLAEQKERERVDAEARREQEAQQRSEQHTLLQRLSEALEAGDLASAGKTLASLDPTLLASADQRRWQALQPQLRELQDWQRWASHDVRQRLCDEVEALEGRGLHPDALATRIRELQQQWRQAQAGGRSDGLDRRFNAACTRILKPARGFFDKRDALRNEHRQQVDTFLTEAEASLGTDDQASLDTDGLQSLQQLATSHLRQLDRLAPGDRRDVADRLRALLDRIRPVIEAQFEAVENERERLIEAAGKLANESDGKRLGNEARSLNQRWQALGKGRRGRDQQQWRRFRAALDQAFANLDSARRENVAAIEARRHQGEALIASILGAAENQGDALTASAAQVRDLREQWQALNLRDADLAERYDEALTRHRLALDRHKASQKRDHWLAVVADAPSSDTGDDTARADALGLVFEAESLAGIDPPDEEREARRQWQLQRLQLHLSGGAAATPTDLDGLLERWRSLDGLDADDRRRFGDRLVRVIERNS